MFAVLAHVSLSPFAWRARRVKLSFEHSPSLVDIANSFGLTRLASSNVRSWPRFGASTTHYLEHGQVLDFTLYESSLKRWMYLRTGQHNKTTTGDG